MTSAISRAEIGRNAPRPGCNSRRCSAASRDSASRAGVRLTPSGTAISSLVRNADALAGHAVTSSLAYSYARAAADVEVAAEVDEVAPAVRLHTECIHGAFTLSSTRACDVELSVVVDSTTSGAGDGLHVNR